MAVMHHMQPEAGGGDDENDPLPDLFLAVCRSPRILFREARISSRPI